jgi:hypothetical protein
MEVNRSLTWGTQAWRRCVETLRSIAVEELDGHRGCTAEGFMHEHESGAGAPWRPHADVRLVVPNIQRTPVEDGHVDTKDVRVASKASHIAFPVKEETARCAQRRPFLSHSQRVSRIWKRNSSSEFQKCEVPRMRGVDD